MRLMSPTIARIMRSEVDQLTRLKSDLEKSAWLRVQPRFAQPGLVDGEADRCARACRWGRA